MGATRMSRGVKGSMHGVQPHMGNSVTKQYKLHLELRLQQPSCPITKITDKPDGCEGICACDLLWFLGLP